MRTDGQIDLTGRPVFVERGEHSVVVTTGVGSVEPVEHDAMDVQRGLAQQEAGRCSSRADRAGFY